MSTDCRASVQGFLWVNRRCNGCEATAGFSNPWSNIPAFRQSAPPGAVRLVGQMEGRKVFPPEDPEHHSLLANLVLLVVEFR